MPLDKASAFITVIPKPGKDPSCTSNSRPLINNDLKILTKILADRISNFIGLYIHKDQVGFIPGRQGPDQIRRAIDVVSLLGSRWDGSQQKGFLLSLDLMKVFDSVSWSFLVPTLQKWGFGEFFMIIIGALYSTPEAKIKMQGYCSKFLPNPPRYETGVPYIPVNVCHDHRDPGHFHQRQP